VVKKAAEPESAETLRRDCRLVSVFGPWGARVLIEMSRSAAESLFELGLPDSPSNLIAAVERDLAELDRRLPGLGDSSGAATALALAYEIEHPYNSATSKSMCARTLNETMTLLRASVPVEEPADDALDLLTAEVRRARGHG